MKPSALAAALLALVATVSSHMVLAYPPALRYKGNPYVQLTDRDYSITDPLMGDGSNFPCKGYQSDIGGNSGSSVATWAAGGHYNFTITGSTTHNGGSCQVSLSYDKGKTFTTIHSYIGGCPTISPPGGSFDFAIPPDAPTGAALFAWTWFNNIGNREMYMSCASVTIVGSGSGIRRQVTNITFSTRPSIFVANLQNGCTTIENTDISFPDPGPDVTNVTVHPGGVIGTCKSVASVSAVGNSLGLPLSSSLLYGSATSIASGSSSAIRRPSTVRFLNGPATHSPADSTASVSASQSTVVSLSNTIMPSTVSSTTVLPSSSIQPSTSGQQTSGYLFSAQSKQNVAVYFGQTPVTKGTTLAAQCADPNIDIVVLAFIISQTYSGRYPMVNFGAACGGQTATMALEAPGLLYCPQLAADIGTCQFKFGKKVLLSIGGANSQITFSSASQASAFGDILWQLFGPPGNIDMNLRPFGDISIDGFDISK
jgi:hypothetical protein